MAYSNDVLFLLLSQYLLKANNIASRQQFSTDPANAK